MSARSLRHAVLALLLISAAGALAELLLIGHTEDKWQWVPVVLLPLAVVVSMLAAGTPFQLARRLFQVSMLVLVASGGVGAFLHYRGNAEFEREMVPSMHGWELVRESMTGATPVLAPGLMSQLGLLGLVWSALGERRKDERGPF